MAKIFWNQAKHQRHGLRGLAPAIVSRRVSMKQMAIEGLSNFRGFLAKAGGISLVSQQARDCRKRPQVLVVDRGRG